MATTTTADEMTPYEFIEAWHDNVEGGLPAPEVLTEAARALHAVAEFMIEPIAQHLQRVSKAAMTAKTRVPEGERTVTYEDIGRLIAFTDEARKDCAYLIDTLGDIALLAHEDLQQIAEGFMGDGVLDDPQWAARMRRFHGLNRLRGDV